MRNDTKTVAPPVPDQSLPVLTGDILAMATFYAAMQGRSHNERMAAVEWLRARFLSDHLNVERAP